MLTFAYATLVRTCSTAATAAAAATVQGSLGSVAFMNLNLAHNSVGFYQLSKLACIPVTLILEAAW
jgi:hypothetical protein